MSHSPTARAPRCLYLGNDGVEIGHLRRVAGATDDLAARPLDRPDRVGLDRQAHHRIGYHQEPGVYAAFRHRSGQGGGHRGGVGGPARPKWRAGGAGEIGTQAAGYQDSAAARSGQRLHRDGCGRARDVDDDRDPLVEPVAGDRQRVIRLELKGRGHHRQRPAIGQHAGVLHCHPHRLDQRRPGDRGADTGLVGQDAEDQRGRQVLGHRRSRQQGAGGTGDQMATGRAIPPHAGQPTARLKA